MTALPAPAHTVGRPARRDAAVRQWSAALLWLSLLVVAYWWDAGGGLSGLGSPTELLLSTGRLSGLLGSDLLLVQVLLMARVPLLETAYGQDRLARIHRVVGFTSFNLIVVHVLLITWGYADARIGQWLAQAWDLTWHYPGMLLAVVGTLALVMVVVTSLRAARRRLRYESWHLLHLYGYLGAGLALPHQLWTGQEFLARPVVTALWWAAWATVAGCVLVFRVGLPLWRNLRHDLRVAAVVAEGPGVVSVHVTGRGLHRLRAEPGQFFHWRFLGRPGWTRANPYSLSAAPGPHGLRLTVRTSGDGGAGLAAVRQGSRVLVEGPYGRLTHRARTRRQVALIGAGVGMAPLQSLAQGLDYAPGEAVLIQRYQHTPLFRAELEELWRTRGLRVVGIAGRRRAEGSWVGDDHDEYDDVQALLAWVPDIAERDVYVCGPEAWVASVRRAARGAGVPEAAIHVELFTW